MDAHAAPAAVDDATRRRIIAGVLTAMLLAALDQTIVAPAMSTIGEALGGAEFLPWIISAYLVTGTAVVPLYGKLADIHGRRPVIFWAVGIFVAGSVVCALAPNMGTLILGRAIQGLGGGGLIALAQTVIGDLVPPRQRAKYTAQISAVWATSSVAGPVVGGAFAEHLHWSLIFWVNLPLAAAAVAMTAGPLRLLPFQPKRRRLDVLGSVLVVAATSLAMLALSFGRMSGDWDSPQVLGLAVASAVASVAFAVRLATFAEPLIPLGVLKDRVVACATGAVFFGMAGFVGLSTLIPVYFEAMNGLPPDRAALGLIAMAAGSVFGAGLTGKTLPKLKRTRGPALIGLALAAIALLGLALAVEQRSIWLTQGLLFVYGLGLGPIFPTATVNTQNAVGRADLGAATGLLAFLRSLGAAFGVAILGALVLGEGGDLEAHGARFVAAIPPQAFALAFWATMAATVAAWVCFLAMPERPLRDTFEPAPLEG
ncbi:MFS transporter [Methylopila jiangsuensis]|uniref:MFS transporter n=1 Tax=Methylopila jiangsuensis TaxID=586230 RepID=A0A9W6N5F2_9HYPH|nr:MFS transporter [Methylopila jiangsuensis]MDR6284438.1 EmrB/QacA subfamily drug resistance transporter [Methylopila jiangsuensis]GLK78176.1 MFS transporter [Methylopila jiangsuensis]